MHQIKFYRTENLPSIGEIGSFYFLHEDINSLYVCINNSGDLNIDYENYSGHTYWSDDSWPDGGGGGSTETPSAPSNLYLPLTGGTMSGDINFNSGSILFGGGQAGSISIPDQGILQLLSEGDSLQLGFNRVTSNVLVNAPKFINTSSSDDYVLLGGGGTKLLSEITAGLATEDDLTAYLPLTGGTMTGDIIPNTNAPEIGIILMEETYYNLGNSSHHFNNVYARSFKGLADGAQKLYGYEGDGVTVSPTPLPITKGDINTPVYFNDGVPVECDWSFTDFAKTEELDNYLPLTGGTMTGDITMSGESKLIFGDISIYDNSDLFIGGNTQVDGRLYVDDTVTASGFKHVINNSNDYVLLAGGGAKLLSEISSDMSGYLPLTGGKLTGPVHINVVGAGGDTFAENYTNFVTNKALVIGPTEAGSIALYINRSGIQMSSTHTDGDSNTSTLNIQAAGGNTTFGGNVNAPKFVNTSSSDDYVLLGGGGTKAISDFALASSLEGYLPLTGGTMTGDITMGSGGPNILFEEGGSIYSNGLVCVSGNILIEGNAQAIAFYETSDIRKKNIKSDLSLDKCYDLIDKCQTVIYSLKDQTQEQVGMIAQEIEEFFPEVVATDENGFKSLAYDRLVVIVFKMLKDMVQRLKKLEQ